MALNPASAAAAISAAYQDASGIDASGNPTGAMPAGNYPADFASAYNDYAMAGVVPGAENTGGDASILEAALTSATSSPATITTLATAFANYWATVAIDPGTPAHGGVSVVSVSNNAATLAALFEAAINASITDEDSSPWFETFISNVQDMAVANIVWTVTELIPPAVPTPFTEVIT